MKAIRNLIIAAALISAAPRASAFNTVSWMNDPGSLFDNYGSQLDGSYSFLLGTFGSSFVPTLANIDQWESQWKLLSEGAWFPGTQEFGNSFTFNSDGTVQGLPGSAVFGAGEQAYLWVRNSSQWALVTDKFAGLDGDVWTLPNPAVGPGSGYLWSLATADTPVIGGVNGIQSGTPYAFDPGSNFALQTAVVPEPASALLVLAAGCLVRLVRSRRSKA